MTCRLDFWQKKASGTSVAFKIQANQLCVLHEQRFRGEGGGTRSFCCQVLQVFQDVAPRFTGGW